jgi:hypothetical protein
MSRKCLPYKKLAIFSKSLFQNQPGFGTSSNDDILSKLSTCLFWDYDTKNLDPNIDRNLILERVFTRGTEKDEKAIFAYYGNNAIRDAVLNIKYLDKKTLNYLSIIFNVSKEKFKCYKKTLSGNPFGSF